MDGLAGVVGAAGWLVGGREGGGMAWYARSYLRSLGWADGLGLGLGYGCMYVMDGMLCARVLCSSTLFYSMADGIFGIVGIVGAGWLAGWLDGGDNAILCTRDEMR